MCFNRVRYSLISQSSNLLHAWSLGRHKLPVSQKGDKSSCYCISNTKSYNNWNISGKLVGKHDELHWKLRTHGEHCNLVLSSLIGLFCATQSHSRNISDDDGFMSFTVFKKLRGWGRRVRRLFERGACLIFWLTALPLFGGGCLLTCKQTFYIFLFVLFKNIGECAGIDCEQSLLSQ